MATSSASAPSTYKHPLPQMYPVKTKMYKYIKKPEDTPNPPHDKLGKFAYSRQKKKNYQEAYNFTPAARLRRQGLRERERKIKIKNNKLLYCSYIHTACRKEKMTKLQSSNNDVYI